MHMNCIGALKSAVKTERTIRAHCFREVGRIAGRVNVDRVHFLAEPPEL
jgi:hypothetical protein